MTLYYNHDSYAPLDLRVQYDAIGQGVVPLDWWNYFVSLTVKLSSRGCWTGTLVLMDREEKFLGGVLTPGQGGAFILRWAWANKPNLIDDAPAFRGGIIRQAPDFTPEGLSITFDVSDNRIPTNSLAKNLPPRKFPDGMTATEIVKAVARSEGWLDKDSQIEDSAGRLEYGFVMGSESHWEFLQQWIVPLSVNDKREAFTCYFDAKGALHFHSPSYAIRGQRTGPLKRYTYARDAMGEVESFQPANNSMFAIIGGAGDGRTTGVDSKGGVPVETSHTVDRGVKGKDQTDAEYARDGASPPSIKGAEDVTETGRDANLPAGPPPPNYSDNAFQAVPVRDADEALRMTQALFARNRQVPYAATMRVHGTHDLAISDVVDVQYDTLVAGVAKRHYLSGMFRVDGIQHTVDASGWHTDLDLYRVGIPAGPASAGDSWPTESGRSTPPVVGEKLTVGQ